MRHRRLGIGLDDLFEDALGDVGLAGQLEVGNPRMGARVRGIQPKGFEVLTHRLFHVAAAVVTTSRGQPLFERSFGFRLLLDFGGLRGGSLRHVLPVLVERGSGLRFGPERSTAREADRCEREEAGGRNAKRQLRRKSHPDPHRQAVFWTLRPR